MPDCNTVYVGKFRTICCTNVINLQWQKYPYLFKKLTYLLFSALMLLISNLAMAQEKSSTDLNRIRQNGYFEAGLIKDSAGNNVIKYGTKYFVKYTANLDSVDQALTLNFFTDTGMLELNVYYEKCQFWLQKMDESGYPFATISSTLIDQKGSILTVKIVPKSGSLFLVDSIAVPNQKFSQKFLFSNMNLSEKNNKYSSNNVQQLVNRISAITGFNYSGNYYLLNQEGKSTVTIPVQTTVKDFARALIGISSVSNPTLGTNRLLLTGELEAGFHNLFGRGVGFGMEWKQYKARSQSLDAKVSLPYMFSVPFITSFILSLDKYDTLFTRFNRGIELKFALNQKIRLLVTNQYQDLTRGYLDIQKIRNSQQLPDNANTRQIWYKGGLEWGNRNTLTALRRGFIGTAIFGAGEKKYIIDPLVDTIRFLSSKGDFWNLYDSLKSVNKFKTTQWSWFVKADKYFSLHKLWVLRLGINCDVMKVPTLVFGELKRYGGAKDLRGFSEQSIYANEWYMSTGEIRFMLSNTAFLSSFINFAKFVNQTKIGGPYKSSAIGMGLGASWKTAAGVLNLVWAVGKSESQPINLQNSKFHIGISNGF